MAAAESPGGSGLPLAPLSDPVALAEWNKRARAILGEPEQPTALEVWQRKRSERVTTEFPVGEIDSFARRQERIRNGEVRPSHRPPATEDGAWERRRRDLADVGAAEYPDNVIPLRARRPRIEREGGDRLPSAGEAWGARESARRGARRSAEVFRSTTGRPPYRKAPAGARTILRAVREERGLSERQAAAAVGCSRAAYAKWEMADDSLMWPGRREWVSRIRAYDPPERKKAPERIRYQYTCQTCGRKKWASIQKGGKGGFLTIPPVGHPRRRKHCEPCLIRTAHARRTPEGRRKERERKAAAMLLAYHTNAKVAEAKRARSRDYYARNLEAQRARKRADYQANKESILAYRRRLRATSSTRAPQTLRSATAPTPGRD